MSVGRESAPLFLLRSADVQAVKVGVLVLLIPLSLLFLYKYSSDNIHTTHLALVDAVRPERQPDDVDEPHANQADGVHLRESG